MIAEIWQDDHLMFHEGPTSSSDSSGPFKSTLSLLPDPVDRLAEYAIGESRAGRTVSLEEFAKANDIPLDDD